MSKSKLLSAFACEYDNLSVTLTKSTESPF
jgi:hypothetical protein